MALLVFNINVKYKTNRKKELIMSDIGIKIEPVWFYVDFITEKACGLKLYDDCKNDGG